MQGTAFHINSCMPALAAGLDRWLKLSPGSACSSLTGSKWRSDRSCEAGNFLDDWNGRAAATMQPHAQRYRFALHSHGTPYSLAEVLPPMTSIVDAIVPARDEERFVLAAGRSKRELPPLE